MKFKQHTTTVNLLTDDEGRELVLNFEPYAGDVIVKEAGSKIVVGYLSNDEWDRGNNYFEEFDQGEFFEFRSSAEVREKAEELQDEGTQYFLVDKYEHGMVNYSVANTANYPDRQWDVAGCCAIYVPPKDVTDPLSYAKATLEEYSNWCNGSIYGVCIDTFDLEGNQTDEEACWGYIGYENAEEEVKQTVDATVKYLLSKTGAAHE